MQIKLCTESPLLEFEAPSEEALLYFLEKIDLLTVLKSLTKKHTSWTKLDSRRVIFSVIGLRQVVTIGRLLNHVIAEKEFISEQETWYQTKKLEYRPIKGKSFSELTFVINEKRLDKSAHKVTRCVKQNKPGDSFYFFKMDRNAGNASTEIEAFNALCYRLLLGNQASKASCVYDEYAVRLGVISREYLGFESMKKRQAEDNSCLVELMVNAGAGKIYMAALLEKENDLHRGNYGFVGDKLVKIDHDQASATVVWKYNPGVKITTPDAFTLTERDIRSLPFLHDAKPFNWVNRRRGKENLKPAINFEGLSQNSQFQQDKFYIGLKRLLIDEAVYKSFAVATIRSPKLQQELIADKANRTKELRAVLLNMPEFIAYVKDNPLAIESILSEISIFNLDFKSDKNRSLAVDMYGIHVNYDTLCYELFPGVPEAWQGTNIF